ncbi:MAG: OpgC family protein [Candidatus Binatia bacterium]
MLSVHRSDRGVVTRQDKPGDALAAVDRVESKDITSVATTSSATERDLRLDFFRGLALFCIFIDHIPNNILASFTMQSLMFADASEVFIFISGYTAGMVYGHAMVRQGFLLTALRVYHRVWQLYVAHVFLFMMFMATVGFTVGALNSSLYAEEFGAANFLDEPGLAVVKALILQFQPAFMDILPLYIVLLALLPFVLTGFRSWPRMVIFACFALWLAVQFDKRIAPSAYPGPDRVWFFNPFAWQGLFFFAAWLGWRGNDEGDSWLNRRWLFYLAAGLSLAGFLIRINWTLHDFYDPIPVPLSAEFLWPLLSKSDLGPLRFANVLALALLVARLIHPQARFLTSRVARSFVICGRNSLHIFCLGILLSVLGHLVLNEFFGGIAMQLAVSAAGVAAMIGVAALMEWFAAAQGGMLRAPVTGRGARG